MKRCVAVAVAAGWLLASGCGDAGKRSGETTGPGKKQRAGLAAPAAAAEELADSAVAALVDEWLRAQNQGDWAAYQRLYAGKFDGVKRIGPRVRRYDRAGWLADRARMFTKPMKVEAADRKVSVVGRVAQVQLTQTFTSGRFRDVGPKQLVIVVENGAPRIAREEMLRSELVASAGARDFHFVLSVGDETYLVLDHAAEPPHGALRWVGTDPMTVVAPIATGDLTAELAAWKGAKLRVEDCDATVVDLAIISRVVPHFATTQQWDCTEQEEAACTPTPDDVRAAQLFEMGSKVVAARLDGCDGRYARRSDGLPMVTGVAVDDERLATRAKAAFAKLPRVIELEAAIEGVPHAGWYRGEEVVAIVRHPTSGRTWVSVAAATGLGCGEFSPSVWQIWEVKKDELVPVYTADAPGELLTTIDVDGDGALHFLVRGNWNGIEAVLVDPATGPRRELGYAFLDCGC